MDLNRVLAQAIMFPQFGNDADMHSGNSCTVEIHRYGIGLYMVQGCFYPFSTCHIYLLALYALS